MVVRATGFASPRRRAVPRPAGAGPSNVGSPGVSRGGLVSGSGTMARQEGSAPVRGRATSTVVLAQASAAAPQAAEAGAMTTDAARARPAERGTIRALLENSVSASSEITEMTGRTGGAGAVSCENLHAVLVFGV